MKETVCTIYKGSRESALYLFVEQGSDLSQVPDELMQRMGRVEEVMTITINQQRRLARVKASSVLAAIAEKGYFLQLPPRIEGQRMTYGG